MTKRRPVEPEPTTHPIASWNPWTDPLPPADVHLDLGSFAQHRAEAHHHQLRQRLGQLRRRRRR